jgi:hypothetical protein
MESEQFAQKRRLYRYQRLFKDNRWEHAVAIFETYVVPPGFILPGTARRPDAILSPFRQGKQPINNP